MGNFRYLAYGSNLCLQHFLALCPGSAVAEKISLPSYELKFRAGLATIERGVGQVPGVVYTVPARARAVLDSYEGVERGLYRPVTIRGAVSYVISESLPLSGPSERYLSLIVEGYRNHGLMDTGPLKSALEEARRIGR